MRLRDVIAGDSIRFHYAESTKDLREIRDFVWRNSALGIDTEATGVNPYRRGWQMRTFQIGDAVDSYVVPARYRKFIGWTMAQQMNWIGHNGPHDMRSIDVHLGYETGAACAGETYIPAHHADSRNRQEGGLGHGLKDLSVALIDRQADKWERALKEEFKKIEIPIPGEVYKSGPRKGMPKVRKAKIAEGWSLIDPTNRAYIAYAAADPLLTYRLWKIEQPVLREFYELYQFDKQVQEACDRLQRRAIRLDIEYTERLDRAYLRKARQMERRAADLGCENIQSGQQIADVLISLGATLRERTDTGKYKTDAGILRGLLNDPYSNGKVKEFIHAVLIAKQLHKRRASYTQAMLREVDDFGRIHPSINSLAARTARMSVREPPLQQLPTKDHEDEIYWDSEEHV